MINPRKDSFKISKVPKLFVSAPDRFEFSVADPDPGSGIGAFLTPGSGIRDPEYVYSGSRIPDLGSRIPNSYF
jgi:hypothetical protein